MASANVNAEKPARAVFDCAINSVKRHAGEILLVGDSPQGDVEGTRAASLAAILLDRDNRYRDYAGAPRIRQLTGRLELL